MIVVRQLQLKLFVLCAALSVAAVASEDFLPLVDSGVHDCELAREDRPNIAGCLSVGTGD